jgi:hypothetical protein
MLYIMYCYYICCNLYFNVMNYVSFITDGIELVCMVIMINCLTNKGIVILILLIILILFIIDRR